MGQPPWAKFYAGFLLGADRLSADERAAGYLAAGVTKDLQNPLVGLLAWRVEGYAGLTGSAVDGGFKGVLTSPLLRLNTGVDYGLRDDDLAFLLGLDLSLRRGGVLGPGGELRLEWLPTRDQTLRIGLTVPLNGHLGRTRPRHDHVRVPSPPRRAPTGVASGARSPQFTAALEHLRQSAKWVAKVVIPFHRSLEADPNRAMAAPLSTLEEQLDSSSAHRQGRTAEQEVRAFHTALVEAFSVATGSQAAAEWIAREARAVLLEEVLFPSNRLLGQRKSRQVLESFFIKARSVLAERVATGARLPSDRVAPALDVFEELLAIVQGIWTEEAHGWSDSRLVWLPLQLALLPEQHDTQAEINSLVGRAAGEPFARGNRIWYMINEYVQLEYARSVHRAEDYHVLWIHDFRGYTDGHPDALAYHYVLHAYLEALTNRVREYDHRGKLPAYFIFIDQYYYQRNGTRLWLDLLEDPLRHRLRLPAGWKAWEDSITAAQAKLRAAVTASALLRERREIYGEAWLRNLVRVHVNVTHPADMSFWSRQLIPVLGLPDNIIRDHRKIAFYDVTEDDPYRGMVIVSGLGIGENYVGPTWEDRGTLVQGPATLAMKHAAYRLLRSQGFRLDEIPPWFRPKPKPDDYAARLRDVGDEDPAWGGTPAHAVILHNDVGYQMKQLDVAKATLYTLLPPGCVLKVPDSLWQNELYGALMLGSALRGVRVLIIAPALGSAPESSWGSMARAYVLLSRLLVAQRRLDDEIARVGGLFKIGLYNVAHGVGDLPYRFHRIYEETSEGPDWLRRLVPFDSTTVAMLRTLDRELAETGAPRYQVAQGDTSRHPRLHMKGHFIASREGWDKLIARSDIAGLLHLYARLRAQEVDFEGPETDVRADAELLARRGREIASAHFQALSVAERQRVIYYLLNGSMNMDLRSMVMDGETMVIVSGWAALVGLFDYVLLLDITTWVEDQATLDRLLPPPSGFHRMIARWMRTAL